MIRFGSLFTLCHGLTRLVNGTKTQERSGACGEFCYRRRPLSNRIQCGSAIERHEGMSLALSGDESWADHPVTLARTLHHRGTALIQPIRQAAPGLVTRAVDPAPRPRCVRIFRIGPGSVLKLISRISPPQFRHASGNSSPSRASSFAQAIRDMSW